MKMKISLAGLGLATILMLTHFGLTFVAFWEAATQPAILKLITARADFLLVWLLVGVMLMLLSLNRLNAVKKLRSEQP